MDELEASDPRRVGEFDLIARLGAGGMGVVYLGRRIGDGHLAAVKLVSAAGMQDASAVALFEREASIARRVRSPFVVSVLAAGRDHGVPYLAMEFVDGRTLNTAVTDPHQGVFSGAGLTQLARGLAGAVAAIHEAGLIHRDLTPNNVMLTAGGPRVIDFGLAKPDTLATQRHTAKFHGTPGFVAPERPGRSTPAGDVYGVGALLLFAAVGAERYGSGRLARDFETAPTPGPELVGVTTAMRRLIWLCLRPEPEDRPDAGTLQHLAASLTVQSTRATTTARAGEFRERPDGNAARTPVMPRPTAEQRSAGPPKVRPRMPTRRTNAEGDGWVAIIIVAVVAAVLGGSFAAVTAVVWDFAAQHNSLPAAHSQSFKVSLGIAVASLFLMGVLSQSESDGIGCFLIVWMVLTLAAGEAAHHFHTPALILHPIDRIAQDIVNWMAGRFS